jgi:hypothetical protein
LQLHRRAESVRGWGKTGKGGGGGVLVPRCIGARSNACGKRGTRVEKCTSGTATGSGTALSGCYSGWNWHWHFWHWHTHCCSGTQHALWHTHCDTQTQAAAAIPGPSRPRPAQRARDQRLSRALGCYLGGGSRRSAPAAPASPPRPRRRRRRPRRAAAAARGQRRARAAPRPPPSSPTRPRGGGGPPAASRLSLRAAAAGALLCGGRGRLRETKG